MQPFHKIHVVTFAANGMPTFTSLLMIAAKKSHNTQSLRKVIKHHLDVLQ